LACSTSTTKRSAPTLRWVRIPLPPLADEVIEVVRDDVES
jgi:hypothetical protein